MSAAADLSFNALKTIPPNAAFDAILLPESVFVREHGWYVCVCKSNFRHSTGKALYLYTGQWLRQTA
jgi:hypothetical protein